MFRIARISLVAGLCLFAAACAGGMKQPEPKTAESAKIESLVQSETARQAEAKASDPVAAVGEPARDGAAPVASP